MGDAGLLDPDPGPERPGQPERDRKGRRGVLRARRRLYRGTRAREAVRLGGCAATPAAAACGVLPVPDLVRGYPSA